MWLWFVEGEINALYKIQWYRFVVVVVVLAYVSWSGEKPGVVDVLVVV